MTRSRFALETTRRALQLFAILALTRSRRLILRDMLLLVIMLWSSMCLARILLRREVAVPCRPNPHLVPHRKRLRAAAPLSPRLLLPPRLLPRSVAYYRPVLNHARRNLGRLNLSLRNLYHSLRSSDLATWANSLSKHGQPHLILRVQHTSTQATPYPSRGAIQTRQYGPMPQRRSKGLRRNSPSLPKPRAHLSRSEMRRRIMWFGS